MADNNQEILLNLKIQTDKSNAALKKTDVAIKKTIQSFKKLKKGSIEYQEAQAKLIGLQANYAKQTLNYNKALQAQIGSGDKGLNGVSKASGGATAATLELGRAISDAPYGIRGVANNLSQFASQFSFMANKVDETTGKVVGFNGAIKSLGKAMRANAVLLAIQLIIAAFDKFAGGSKKASKATEEFSNLVDKKAGKLLLLKDIMNDSNVSLEDKKKIISDVNGEFEDLNITIDKQGKLTKTSQKNIDKLTESLVKNAKAQAVLGMITKEQSKIVQIEIERSKKIAEGGVGAFEGTLDDLEKQRKKYIDRQKKQIDNSNLSEIEKKKALDNYMKSSSMQRFDALANFRSKDIKDAKDRIKELQKIITGESLFSIFKDKSKGKKSGVIKLTPDPKEFNKELEDYLSQLDSLYEKTQLAEAKLESDKIKIRKDAHLKRLQVKQDEDLAKFKAQAKTYETEYFNFLEHQVRMGEISQEEADNSFMELVERNDREISENKSGFDSIISGWIAFYDKKISVAKKSENEELDNLLLFIDNYKKITAGLSKFIDGEFKRQLTIEQNKTNGLNKELNDRLLNENLSKDERAKIQNQIAINDDELRKKQNKIKKKQFDTQKAFNISTAISNTISAGISASRQTYGGAFAKIAAMTAVIGSGMAQVAIIARQKFQPEAANTPIRTSASGGSTGASERSEPSFNIVGRSGENLLINAIQAQFGKPLKAYVVSRDVTTQQQLDGMIVGQAGT
jgi:hypothetical protein